jgi:hypothetical protein
MECGQTTKNRRASSKKRKSDLIRSVTRARNSDAGHWRTPSAASPRTAGRSPPGARRSGAAASRLEAHAPARGPCRAQVYVAARHLPPLLRPAARAATRLQPLVRRGLLRGRLLGRPPASRGAASPSSAPRPARPGPGTPGTSAPAGPARAGPPSPLRNAGTAGRPPPASAARTTGRPPRPTARPAASRRSRRAARACRPAPRLPRPAASPARPVNPTSVTSGKCRRSRPQTSRPSGVTTNSRARVELW